MRIITRAVPSSYLCLVISALFYATSIRAETAPAAGPDSAKPRMNIAVLTLRSASGVSEGEAEILTDRLRAELFNTGAVNIMEREQMQAILKEQGFQQSGACTDEACMVEMGKMLGVQQLYTGSIGKVGSIYLINLRIIDVRTGQVLKAVSRDINGMDVVVSKLSGISRELVGLDQTPATAAPAKTEPPPQPQSPPPQPQQPPAQAAQAPAPPPPPAAPLSPADDLAQKNKNRFGIRIGFTALFGETWWYYDTAGHTSFDSAFNKSWDTIVSQPIMVPNIKFIIPLGPVLSLELGGGYAFWSQHFADAPDTASGTTKEEFDVTNSYIGIEGSFNFVKRWYPFKLNAGVLGGYNFFSTSNKERYTSGGYDYTDEHKDLEFQSNGASIGGRCGVEIMAGPHVGFNIDFIYRYLAFRNRVKEIDPSTGEVTDAYDFKIKTPSLGASGGINFYF